MIERARVSSLYVHVPFCAHKCAYCAFYSEAATGDLINRYVAALGRELEGVAGDFPPRTVFFGGGTPSLLNLRQWERVLGTLHRLGLGTPEEWTVECNPATLSADKARLLRAGGVNRVSLGIQALDDALLERLGRIHTRDQARRSFDLLREAGFDNVNLDLMFAIPGQTLEAWQRTLDEALAWGSEHLACYEVIYEEDTPLFARLEAGEFAVDEDLACDMYELLVDRAGAAGLRQYEVANFARDHAAPEPAGGELPGRACRHNVNYWRGGAFHGCGPSATSYVHGVRARNWANTPRYCEGLEQGRRPVESTERLSPRGRAGETAAFGLRMNRGWGFDEFCAVTGFDLRRDWAADMARLVAEGLAEADARGFRLNARGLRFADRAAEAFLRLEDTPAPRPPDQPSVRASSNAT